VSPTGHGIVDWLSGFSGGSVVSVSGLVSQVVNGRRVLVASLKSNGPSRILAHCSGDQFREARNNLYSTGRQA
jgi:hypothetical protein